MHRVRKAKTGMTINDKLIKNLVKNIIDIAKLRLMTGQYQNMNSAIVSVTNDIDLKLMDMMGKNNENT